MIDASHPLRLSLFRAVVLSWTAAHTIVLLPSCAIFWGPSSYSVVQSLARAAPSLSANDQLLLGAGGGLLLPVLQLVTIAAALIDRRIPRLWCGLAWLATMNLNVACPEILDGGNNLMEIMLFYCMFIDPRPEPSLGRMGALLSGFSVAAVRVAQVQYCLVYLTASVSKLHGPSWRAGTALADVSRSLDYSTDLFAWLFSWSWVSEMFTYATLAYQLSFAALIWFRFMSPALLCCCLLFHAGIAAMLGLVMFSLAMMSCAVLFIPADWLDAVAKTARSPPQTAAAAVLAARTDARG